MARVGAHSVVVTCGAAESGEMTGDAYVLDCDTWEWRALSATGPVEGRTRVQALPSTRLGHWDAAAELGDARMARTVVSGAGLVLEAWHWGPVARTHPGLAPPPLLEAAAAQAPELGSEEPVPQCGHPPGRCPGPALPEDVCEFASVSLRQ